VRPKWKRQWELNDYVVEELKELRHLIQQLNSEHAAVRDATYKELQSLARAFRDRTDHLA
jgi:hypothetical protein